MSRVVTVGAAQPVQSPVTDTRKDVVERLLALLVEGDERGCDLVVFPESASDDVLPVMVCLGHRRVRPLLRAGDARSGHPAALRRGPPARRVGFCLGYAELTEPDSGGTRHRFNTQVLVERDGLIVARYRKVHLPGHELHEPERPFQHAERYFFEPGPDEFGVWPAFGGSRPG